MSSRPSYRTIAITLSALLLPLSILAGLIAAAYFKSTNPNNVDITNGLAYLQHTMFFAIGVGVAIGVNVVWLIVSMYRRDKNFVQAKLPLTILISVVAIIGAIGILSSYTSSVEDQYRTDRGQPTLQEFFDALDKNKS